mmetsp:Transcript_4649/g.7027  ORF Transcript_4649/g.7027 Transcript_4649/m.7027 type:complete len:210 (+) Transcript_4649:118-747(+)
MSETRRRLSRSSSKSFKKNEQSFPKILGGLSAELRSMASELKAIGWRNMKPWGEFFEKFKAPKDWSKMIVEERIKTNFLHFRGNYIALLLGSLCLTIVYYPILLLATLFTIPLLAFLFPPMESSRRVVINGKPLKFTQRKIIAGVWCSFVCFTTGVIFKVIYPVSVTALLCLGHALFRPRNLKSKANKLGEDLKQSAGAGIDSFLKANE